MALTILAVSNNNYAAISQLEFNIRRHEAFRNRNVEIISFCTLRNVLHVYNCLNPDILLIDFKWPEFTCIEKTKGPVSALLAQKKPANIVIMTTNYCLHTQQYMRMYGVKGYAYLDSPYMAEKEVLSHFVLTLEKAANGEAYFHYPSTQEMAITKSFVTPECVEQFG